MAKKNKLVATVFSAALVTSALAAPVFAAEVTSPTSVTKFAAAGENTSPDTVTTQNVASATAKSLNDILPGVTVIVTGDVITITENGNSSTVNEQSLFQRILNALFN